MATILLPPPIDVPSVAAVFSLLSFLLLTPRSALAQPLPPPSGGNNSNNSNNGYYNFGKFSPTMAIVIVVMICVFFFLGFFSIYIRNCSRGDDEFSVSFRRRAGAGAARSRRQRGLSAEVIATFPTMVYAEVKEMKLGKGALECAVCLCEFDEEEELRLLPRCSHVFHPDCIDAWLASHVTCPVCRDNLAEKAEAGELDIPPAAAPEAGAEGFQFETAVPVPDHVPILVDRTVVSAEVEKEREEAALELARIGSQRRAARSRSGHRPAKFSRSHSTGHSVVRRVEDVDRYTLRLPEHIRNQILAARKFHRSTSCVAYPTDGEGTSRQSRRGWGGGDEGSSRGWRSFRLRKSDRWPSFFFRSLSLKVPAWAAGRRGEDEGSVKKSEGDAFARGKTPV